MIFRSSLFHIVTVTIYYRWSYVPFHFFYSPPLVRRIIQGKKLFFFRTLLLFFFTRPSEVLPVTLSLPILHINQTRARCASDSNKTRFLNKRYLYKNASKFVKQNSIHLKEIDVDTRHMYAFKMKTIKFFQRRTSTNFLSDFSAVIKIINTQNHKCDYE